MLTQLSKALETLDATNLDRYIKIVVNNPNLGAFNHAYLFNQGNIEKYVLPENSIVELGKRSTGVEGQIFLPVFKEEMTFARAKVKEVRPPKKSDVGINHLTRFFQVFGITPLPTELLWDGRFGHFDKGNGEAYIAKNVYTSQFSDKGMINRAVLEILAELFATEEEVENRDYNRLLVYMVLLNEGYYPSKPDIDMKNLKAFLNEERLLDLSLILKRCHYLVEGVVLDFEEIMLLRALMKEDKNETLGLLERIEATTQAKTMIKGLRYKLMSCDDAAYAELFMVKEAKKLRLHQDYKGLFDTKKYFKNLDR